MKVIVSENPLASPLAKESQKENWKLYGICGRYEIREEGRDRVLSVDVRDQDTWDMVYYLKFMKKKKKDEQHSENRKDPHIEKLEEPFKYNPKGN